MHVREVHSSEDFALGSKALACHVHMNFFGLDGRTLKEVSVARTKLFRALTSHLGRSEAGSRSHTESLWSGLLMPSILLFSKHFTIQHQPLFALLMTTATARWV